MPLARDGTIAEPILLVEDDPELRELLVEYVGSLGLPVLEFASGEDALDALRERELAPALVISDVRMAGMSGLELAETLRRDRPHLPVILMSAFGSPQLESGALDAGATAYLDKPFRLPAMAELIRRMLDSAGSG